MATKFPKFSQSLAQDPATRRIWYGIATAHDLEAHDSMTEETLYQKIFASHFGHLAIIFLWTSGNLFHVAWQGNFEQWIQMGAKVSNREKGTFSIDYSVKPWSLDWTMTSSGIRRISLFNFGDNETLNVITGESKPEDWEDGQIMQYKYNQ